MSSVNGSDTDALRARNRRRKNKRVRQTIIFGSLCGAMVVVLLFAYGIYNGTIAGPFDIAFTSDKEDARAPTPPPCPGPEDTPVPYSDVEINVYNTTDVSGLAASAADEFRDRGFEVLDVSNEEIAVNTTAELRFGPHAIAAAYTLEAQLDGALLRLDEDRMDTTVDVLLGANYDELRPSEMVDLVPDEPFSPLSNCVPITVPTEEPEDPADADDTEEPPLDDEDAPSNGEEGDEE